MEDLVSGVWEGVMGVVVVGLLVSCFPHKEVVEGGPWVDLQCVLGEVEDHLAYHYGYSCRPATLV